MGGRARRHHRWRLSADSRALVTSDDLERRIFTALSAAAAAGTDPSISGFHVRAATVVEHGGKEHVIVGGNTEYHVPEALHGETALLNHVTSLLGPRVTREKVHFIAYYADRCGRPSSCGDCRDYQIATTDYRNLLTVCGQSSDFTAHVFRFADDLVDEDQFPEVSADQIDLARDDLERLVSAAVSARLGGVSLFVDSRRHTGAAALSERGRLYRAAGVDDAAFHYRYPIGGLLQQAATEGDYHLRAIVVAGEPGQWPPVSYRDRQYGNEFSSFNRRARRPPIALILTDGLGHFRATTFEQALPNAFTADRVLPGRVDSFLREKRALGDSDGGDLPG